MDASGDGGTEVEATFWGDMSELPLVEGRVIGIKGAKVSEYGGKSLNLSSDHADIFDKDQLDEAAVQQLERWYKNRDESN